MKKQKNGSSPNGAIGRRTLVCEQMSAILLKGVGRASLLALSSSVVKGGALELGLAGLCSPNKGYSNSGGGFAASSVKPPTYDNGIWSPTRTSRHIHAGRERENEAQRDDEREIEEEEAGWSYEKACTIPNLISFARLVSGPCLGLCITHDMWSLAVGGTLVAGMSSPPQFQ